jgi:pantoate--beta-alanine ligase
MQVIEQIAEMQYWSERARQEGSRIVLVPTMGFLHEGHLSLVRDGRRRGSRLVVSIFVNPKQFSLGEDYTSYPRDFSRDQSLLAREGVDVIFCPSAAGMYPDDHQTHVEVGKLGARLCGVSRPGHFRGVATVVAKLFSIVRPHIAVFGQKDFQQLQVIRRLVLDLNLGVEIVAHPTVREKDGLAMSSRNAYLNTEERQAAVSLSRSLKLAASMVQRGERRAAPILAAVKSEIEKATCGRIDYVELCDPETLEPVASVKRPTLLALAVWFGRARLIDNTILDPRGS